MIITVANQKGGSGKTTTAAAIVSGATMRGKDALAIDLDPQCNLTFIMGGEAGGAYDLITQKAATVQYTEQGDLIGGNIELATADSTLTGSDRVFALQEALDKVRDDFDIIVIDSPPLLGTLLFNALAASDGVVIPIRAKMTNVQGLYLLAQTIRKTQAEYNQTLHIMGVLLTEHNGRTIASRNVTQQIRETAAALDMPVFNTAIRQGVAIDEAQIMRESVFEYAPKSNPAQDYAAFLDEIGI